MDKFDLIDSPLAGLNLIEASAGSGKTHAIARIFIRLLLEKELTIDQILAVTFTEAATEELRKRIRNDLHEAVAVFTAPLPPEQADPFFREILVKELGLQSHTELKAENPLLKKKKKQLLERLVLAMRSFDETNIYTIHGFCRKVLKENAFESSTLFDTELITDQTSLVQNILDDFWRTHIVNESQLFLHYLINKKIDQTYFFKILATNLTKPLLTIYPKIESLKTDTVLLETEFTNAFQSVASVWINEKSKITACLLGCESLHKQQYKPAIVDELMKSCDYFFLPVFITPFLFSNFEKLTAIQLAKATKVGQQTPEHHFFNLCEQLQELSRRLLKAFEDKLVGLEVQAFHFMHEQLAVRKRQQNIQFFHDLLMNLYDALREKGQEHLVNSLLIKYKAILIDEFQDTDPVQYYIFSRLYRNQSHLYFLIGDPKQSIYSFRGADIYAYLQASRKDETHVKLNKYTLSLNWRSEQKLITSVNKIFLNRPLPFLLKEIEFHEAVMAEQTQVKPLLYQHNTTSQNAAGLVFWVITEHEKEGRVIGQEDSTTSSNISKAQATQGAIQAVVGEIIRLLNNKNFRLGEKHLQPNDLAILVRKNYQALQMQQALREYGVPSVLFSLESIFTSHEALELERILLAIEEPGKEALLKSALVTDYFGLTGQELYNLLHNEHAWEEWLQIFRHYHFLWHKTGFFKMMRTMISTHEIRMRLLSFADGERRLTNLLHLTELLHQAAIENNLDMAGLIKWYANQLLGNDEQKTEHQIRLETDENAVRIITIHKSKGLQYPIVFCPFLWDMPLDKKEHFTFHDENYNLILELGSDKKEEHKELANREELAENLRLLYVALTRARNKCYVVWGKINLAENSGLAYLLHPVNELPFNTDVNSSNGDVKPDNTVWSTLKLLSTQDIINTLQQLSHKTEGAIKVEELPRSRLTSHNLQRENQTSDMNYRLFNSIIDPSFKITSFSTLTQQQPDTEQTDSETTAADHDFNIQQFIPDFPFHTSHVTTTSRLENTETSLFYFPGGTKTGIFIHSILEKVNFQKLDESTTKQLIAEHLNFYGFEPKWLESIQSMLKELASLMLDGKELCLAKVLPEHMNHELEFYYPLKSIDVHGLANLFRKHVPSFHTAEASLVKDYWDQIPEQIDKLRFSPVKGFMHGFIDLIFLNEKKYYLIDWKSNLLGRNREDYASSELKQAMLDDYYFLQYYLYTLALHKFLTSRMPGYDYQKHFGGIYYLFLRGISSQHGPEYGVFHDLPPWEMIQALETYMLASS